MTRELQAEGVNYNVLFAHLTDLTSLSLPVQDRRLIRQSVQFRQLKKKQFFGSAGELCKHLVYIAKGSMRIYATDEKGREHTICLAVENTWISDYESFHGGIPSQYFIIAMEDCEIFQINYKNLSYQKKMLLRLEKWFISMIIKISLSLKKGFMRLFILLRKSVFSK